MKALIAYWGVTVDGGYPKKKRITCATLGIEHRFFSRAEARKWMDLRPNLNNPRVTAVRCRQPRKESH